MLNRIEIKSAVYDRAVTFSEIEHHFLAGTLFCLNRAASNMEGAYHLDAVPLDVKFSEVIMLREHENLYIKIQ